MANPHVQDSAYWESALEHYHWDRLEQAYSQIRHHGVGEAGSFLRWYRIIEAETITRRKSETMKVAPWLTLEFIPSEILDLRDDLIELAISACDEVAGRLGWDHRQETRLAILAEETDAPWAANPYGYCVSKEPYEKICLPNYLVDDPEEYAQAVAHEYAHVISAVLAEGYAPRWLEEALSVLVERRFDVETWDAFRSGEEPWLSPAELELTLDGRVDDTDDGAEDVWCAYQQAGWIGRYLASLGEEQKLGRLLRDVANESVGRNLRLSLFGKERVDGALQAVYGLDSRKLFAQAFDFLCARDGV